MIPVSYLAQNFKVHTNSERKDIPILLFAVNSGSPDLTEFLLKKGADPNAFLDGHKTPLQVACSRSDHKLVKSLIDYGAQPNLKSYVTALMCALKCRVTKDKLGRKVIRLSDEFADTALIELLLSHGATFDFTDKDQRKTL